MNLPNKLTLARVVAIPVFLLFLLCNIGGTNISRFVSLGIFAAASITDFFDGRIARKRNLVTNFGRLVDPLADKLLVCAACVAMVELRLMPAWAVILIVSRELIITGLRELALEQGKIISSSYWGKVKTAMQMIMILYLLLPLDESPFRAVGWFLIWIAAALTVISAVDYIWKNRALINGSPENDIEREKQL